MESLMNGLMARAAGKKVDLPAFIMTSHHSAESFVSSENLRQQSFHLSSDEDTPSSVLSATSSNDSWESASDVSNASETSIKSSTTTMCSSSLPLPSNQPRGSVSGYAFPPTYLRGDYFNLSPSYTPKLTSLPDVSQKENKRLSFSIDSILGSSNSSSPSATKPTDTPAYVTSSLSTANFRFSHTDWSIFQPSIRLSSSCTQDSEKLYWCHACEDFCGDESDVTRHQTSHTGNGDVCKLRRVFFNSHGYVTSHEATNVLNRIKCGLCKRVVTRYFFHKHLRSHDGHICDVCGHEAPTNGRLEDHMNKHTGANPYRCKVCDQHFSDKQQLSNHSRKHRPSSTQCQFCSKVFKSKYSCAVHERMHTGVHSVTGCDKSFPQKIQLQLHENFHAKCSA